MVKHCPKEISFAKAEFEWKLAQHQREAILESQSNPQIQELREQATKLPSKSKAEADVARCERQLAKYRELLQEKQDYLALVSNQDGARNEIATQIQDILTEAIGAKPELPEDVAEYFEFRNGILRRI